MNNKPTLNHHHQIVPKFEKTDANRLADAIEEIARLEKALAESEKRGSELAASYCDGVIGDEYGHPHCRYKVERDAALDRVSEYEAQVQHSVPGNAAALVRAEGKKYSLNAAGMLDSGAPEHAQTFAIVQLLSEFDDEEAESHWEAIMAYSDFRTSDALFHAAELLAAPCSPGSAQRAGGVRDRTRLRLSALRSSVPAHRADRRRPASHP